MNKITRILQAEIENRMLPGKVMLLFGARRVGKTILIKSIAEKFSGKILFLNGEDATTHVLLQDKTVANYTFLLNGVKLLIIDEAQNISDIGAKLKLIVDELPAIYVIASGSSSFDLLNLTGEPLVGRSKTFYLFPFSQEEMLQVESGVEVFNNLEQKMIFGTYPQLLNMNPSEKQEYLTDLVNGYLLKDILSIEGLRNSNKMSDLLKLIAFQTGNLVSYDELGRQLGLSKNTVEKYLDLLSKVFIVYRLNAFSGNLRKEISKSGKWYFYDNGIRNALISNFSPLSIRTDVGQLWESFVLSERIKRKHFHLLPVNHYFWRTYDQQEVDLIEVQNQEIKAYECKWSAKSSKAPVAFSKIYLAASFTEINKQNFINFIT
ncbi:MAG: ATP-binding protein [Paludibacter sp.]